MAALTYQLIHTPGRPTVTLRELNGFDELAINDNGSRAILKLLGAIMTASTPDKTVVSPEKIVISDRDYLLSGVYSSTYGSRIQSVLKCRKCASPFDLDFSLDDLVSSVRGVVIDQTPNERGYFDHKEFQFRLPDGEDELAVAGLPVLDAEKGILKRCVMGGGTVVSETDVQLHMKSLAPLLLNEVQTICPECGEQQIMIFDMQTFLLSRMKNERKRIVAEVHCIATAYHWSHNEILGLSRTLRKTYAGLIGLE